LSPDTMRLAFYCLKEGRLSAGVFDLPSSSVKHFGFTPNYLERLAQKPVWISDDEVVFPALPDGAQPAATFRIGIAAKLNELWGKTFAGQQSSATVLRSTSDGIENSRQMRAGMLMRVDARSGRASAFGSGYFYNLRLSPSGRFLAALREGGDIQPSLDEPPIGVERAFREIVVFDLDTGSSESPCPDCHAGLGSLNWSADGSVLTFVARKRGEPIQNARLYRYRARQNSLEPIDARDIHYGCGAVRRTMIRSVGVGEDIAICRRDLRRDWVLLSPSRKTHVLTGSLQNVYGELLGQTERSLFVLADGAVWEVSRDKQPRKVTRGIEAPLTPWSVGADAAMSRSREDNFTSARIPLRYTVLESDKEVVTVDVRRGIYSRLARPSTEAELLDITPTPEGEVSVFREDTARGTSLILVRAGATRVLERLNTGFAEIELPSIVTLEHGCLFLPPGWTAEKRYPLVADVYPENPTGNCDSDYRLQMNPLSLRFLAAHGYVVLSPATPRELTKTPEGPMKAMTSVVLAAVDEAVKRGYADPDRMGVFGFSQGFTSALQVLTETTRFRAAVVGSGIGDFASHYGTISLRDRLASESVQGAPVGNFPRYESDNSAMYLGARPWENPARFAANSPVFHAQHINAPLLIFHSDFDGFPLGQSEQLFSALYRLRKDATYVTYWGEGHGNTSPANLEDLWQRVFAWFDEYL
jgi:dipeptidyl aminopeptidase/acylaminoacyl peptidase